MLLNLGRDIRVKSAGLGMVLCPERTKNLAFPTVARRSFGTTLRNQ